MTTAHSQANSSQCQIPTEKLFDDTGVVYNRSDGWRVHNGLGFGLRSKSPLGIVSLSFGVGDSISFEDTKIHIAMYQTF
ncbi:MAG: hypothetical protein B6D63_05410 [Candidatus Latescibacteria bacterium 4484_7]|nr:MAG: hypothetical protein B6D63_05410 [Candidatus Latescibacteria bacterium 4484_7]